MQKYNSSSNVIRHWASANAQDGNFLDGMGRSECSWESMRFFSCRLDCLDIDRKTSPSSWSNKLSTRDDRQGIARTVYVSSFSESSPLSSLDMNSGTRTAKYLLFWWSFTVDRSNAAKRLVSFCISDTKGYYQHLYTEFDTAYSRYCIMYLFLQH